MPNLVQIHVDRNFLEIDTDTNYCLRMEQTEDTKCKRLASNMVENRYQRCGSKSQSINQIPGYISRQYQEKYQ